MAKPSIANALAAFAVFFSLGSNLPAQQPASPANWSAWQFLLGEWVGEGTGDPGQGSGTFSFQLDLQKRILVRKNRADYPATKDRPAFSHEDLMVIYQDTANSARAIYFDNEGHVIHYAASFSKNQDTLTFVSTPMPSAPRFRLTYVKGKNQTLGIKFDIAPPGKPEEFAPYIQATARRK